MRSLQAASAAVTVLGFLAFGGLFGVSVADAAPRCPLGQILRVSKGVCVSKSRNLALLSRYSSKRRHAQEHAEEDAGASDPAPAPAPATVAKRSRSEPATAEPAAETPPLVRVAERDATAAEQPRPSAPAAAQPDLSSPFGALYVGAFRSSLTTGFSVAK